MIVRDALVYDIPALALIHLRSLPEDFLPSLGQDFLEKVFYPAAVASTHGKTLVIEKDGTLAGFVTIAHDSDEFSRDVLRNQWLMIARYALRAAIKNPAHLLKSAEVSRSVLLSKPDPVRSEIVFIAVSPEHQGQGFGKTLVTAALEYLESQGVMECRTKTLSTNLHVIRMYERMGWAVRNHIRLIGHEYAIITHVSQTTHDPGGLSGT